MWGKAPDGTLSSPKVSYPTSPLRSVSLACGARVIRVVFPAHSWSQLADEREREREREAPVKVEKAGGYPCLGKSRWKKSM